MPVVQKPKPILFKGADDVTLSLPHFLFCEDVFLSTSISPTATVDPAQALQDRPWASASAPSRQPNPKIIIIDRACAPHPVSFADNIAFVTRMCNAGFKVVMCLNEGGANSFVEVKDDTNLYQEFSKLGRFNHDADPAILAAQEISSKNSIFLDPKLRVEVLKCLTKVREVKLDPKNLWYKMEFNKSTLLYSNEKSGAIGDEMCSIFNCLSDSQFKEIFIEFQRLNGFRKGSLILDDMVKQDKILRQLIFCNKKQAENILGELFRPESNINIGKRPGLINALFKMCPDIMLQESLPLITSAYIAKELKVKRLLITSKDKFFYKISPCIIFENSPNLSEEVVEKCVFDTGDLESLSILLKINPNLAKKVIEGWPDKSRECALENLTEIIDCFETSPHLAELLFQKLNLDYQEEPNLENNHTPEDRLIVLCASLKYLPQDRADELAKEILANLAKFLSEKSDRGGLYRLFCATYLSYIIEGVSESLALQVIDEHKEKLQGFGFAAAFRRFSHLDERFCDLAIQQIVENSSSSNSELIASMPERYSEEIVKNANSAERRQDIALAWLKRNPYEVLEILKKDVFKKTLFEERRLAEIACFSNYLVDMDCLLSGYNYNYVNREDEHYRDGIVDIKSGDKKSARTFLHVSEIDNEKLDVFEQRKDDFEHVAVLRIVEIDSVDTLKKILKFLPSLKHMVLPENIQWRLEILRETEGAEWLKKYSIEFVDYRRLYYKGPQSLVSGLHSSDHENQDLENQDLDALEEDLQSQGEIGEDEALHAGDGVKSKKKPVQRSAPSELGDNSDYELSMLQQSFKKLFAMEEIADEAQLNSKTVNVGKKKILIATSSIDSHANHFLQLVSNLQDSQQKREVFYIDHPDKINFDQLVLQIDAGSSQVLISKEGALERFLKSAAETQSADRPAPLLMINWKNFNAQQRLALNTILDINRKIGGIEITPNVQIIGFIDAAPKDRSFISRHDLCVKSSTRISTRPLLANHAPIKIDLQGFPNWRRQLFGRVVLINNEPQWQKSYFTQLLEEGKNNFEILNISPEAAAELKYEMDQARARGYFEYHQYKIPIAPNFNLNLDNSAFDFRAFSNEVSKRDFKVATAQTYQDIPEDTQIINSHLFDLLLQNKKIERGVYEETLGLIEQHRGSGAPLKLFITTDLSESQWYCLFSQACEKNVRLELYLAESAKIPVGIKFDAHENKIAMAAAKKSPQGPRLFVSNDTNQTLQALKSAKNALVIDVEDSAFQDLVLGITFDPLNAKSAKFCNFSGTKGAILQALEQGREIILKGKFAPDLMQFLQPFFVQQYHDRSVNLQKLFTIILEDDSLSASSCDKSHNYLSWLPKDFYQVEFYEKTRVKTRAAKSFKESPDSSELDASSEDKSAAFIAARKAQFTKMLGGTSMLQLVGHSGVGKSRLMKMLEEEDHSQFTIFREMTGFKEWAKPADDGKVKILFIDESNIEDQHFMMFAPLKAGGNKIISYKGEIFKLGLQHKVVFAHNDKEYGGGRVEQKLFADGSIPEMHLADFPTAYIYEKILKDSIYNKLRADVKEAIPEADFREHCKGIIAKYQTHNHAAKTPTDSLTVRELQEQALEFLAQKFSRAPYQEVVGKNFISTKATKQAEESLALTLQIRALQHEKIFPSEAVGINGILLEGDSGTGKSEMIGAMLESRGIVEASKAQAGQRRYYKIDASQDLAQKRAAIIKAFEEGAIIWIDELNSCIDDGLEKILNAALTGAHPDTGKKSANSGFTLISSVNQISMEGRSSISPALRHRTKCQKTKSLKEYSVEDFRSIIAYWIADVEIDSKDSVVAAIANDFFLHILSAEGKHSNLRDLRYLVCEDLKLLQEYLKEIQDPQSKKIEIAERLLRQVLAKQVNFKEKAAAIDAFIAHELPSISDEKRAEIQQNRVPEFLSKPKDFVHYHLSAEKVQDSYINSENQKIKITADDWNKDNQNPYSYLSLKEEFLAKPGYEEVFKFDDSDKSIKVCASIYTLIRLDDETREILLQIFPQFKILAHKGNELSVEGLKSQQLLDQNKTASAEMQVIAGHETVFTKAELEQELFFRQETIKKPIPPVNSFEDLLRQSFCVGELHDHESSKRILVDNMAELKEKGYGTIFLEGLVYDSIEQKLLDEYFDLQFAGEMNPLLQEILQGIDRNNSNIDCDNSDDKKFGYYQLVVSAKKNGLQVVGIESSYSIVVPKAIDKPGDNKVKRCKDMNYAAAAIIKARSPSQKWVAIMGTSHMKTVDGVAGVGEIMGVPSVYVYDSKKDQAKARFCVKKVGDNESEARIACPKKMSLEFRNIAVAENAKVVQHPPSASPQPLEAGSIKKGNLEITI